MVRARLPEARRPRRASTWPTERSCGAQTARHRATGNGGTVDSAPPVCATNLVTTLKPACLPSSERAAANRVLVVDTRGMSTTVAPGSSHQSWPERRVVVRSGSGPAIRAGWLQLSTRLHGFMFKISRFIARPLIRVGPLDVSRGVSAVWETVTLRPAPGALHSQMWLQRSSCNGSTECMP